MRPVSRGYSRHSHVDGDTCRKTPISQSAQDKNSMPGHLFEGNPVGEVTIRRGTDTPVRRTEKPAVSTHSSTRCVRHPEHFERQAGFPSSDKTRPDSPVQIQHFASLWTAARQASLSFTISWSLLRFMCIETGMPSNHLILCLPLLLLSSIFLIASWKQRPGRLWL